MKKYGYNAEIHKQLSWRKIGLILGGIISILIFAIVDFGFGKDLDDFTSWEVFWWIVVIPICSVVDIFTYIRMNNIANNLLNCYLTISDDGVCGYAFDKIHENGNGRYCEVEFENIRDIRVSDIERITKSVLFNSNDFYNLIIDCPGGSYKFCIDRPYEAKKELDRVMKIRSLVKGEVDSGQCEVFGYPYHPKGECDGCGKNADLSRVTIQNAGSRISINLCEECIDKYIGK